MSNTGRKKTGWFKSNFDSQHDNNNQQLANNRVENEVNMEDKNIVEQKMENALSRENKDKFIADLVNPLENLIRDREILKLNNKDLKDKLSIASETISRMRSSIDNNEQRIAAKDSEIKVLEKNLAEKQHGYDQLLEDYKKYQSVSRSEYVQISNKLDMEVSKYKRFHSETASVQRVNLEKINSLEEKIRSLEIENAQYQDQYARVNKEKEALMKNIDDFTKRMSNPILFTNSEVVEEVKEKVVDKAKENFEPNKVDEKKEEVKPQNS